VKKETDMTLAQKKAALLVEDMYNEFEVWIPYYRLKEEGVVVTVVGSGTASTYFGKYGIPIPADKSALEVTSDDFDLVIIPGGYAPDKMRIHPEMVRLVKDAVEKGKVVASICHGGWMLASANVVKDRRVTSYVAIKDDLINAGALWEDSEVVRDGLLITSRKPDDLPAFCRAIISALNE
jgi:deglycase